MVRHRGGVVVVVSRRRPRAAAPPRRRGVVVWVAAGMALLIGVVALFVAGMGTPVPGACPASVPVSVAGGTLWVRTEPDDGRTALIHLCVDAQMAPVQGWSVRAGDAATAVLRLTDRLAIAAVTEAADGVPLVVEVRTQAGDVLRFRTPMPAAGLPAAR